MNFDDAIKAHTDWKMKLTSYLRKPDDSLNPDVVCKDDQCTLGKWLYGEGARYNTLPEFAKLKSAHASFHLEAAEIIRRAKKGESVSEETALGAKSRFSDFSGQVIMQIRTIRNKIEKAA